MTKYLTKNQSAENGARKHFKKRIKYLSTMSRRNADHINVINFNRGERIFYGRVNKYYAPIALDFENNYAKLSTIKNSNNTSNPVQALDFVAQTFDLMCEQFRKDAAAGKLTNGAYLTSLKAYRGFESPIHLYNNYRRDYSNKIKAKIQGKNLKFTTFDEFVSVLIQETQFALPTSPLTFPGFIKSNKNNILTTGLAIEVADVSYSSDLSKIATFLNSPNWNYFVTTCSSFGFMVDQNVPWRIIADMSPEATRKRQQDLLLQTYPLDLLYSPAGFLYLPQFLEDLLEIYNNVRFRKFEKTVFCEGKTITKTFYSQTYTADQVYKLFTNEKKIVLYCTLRLNEEKSNLHDNAKKMIVLDCLKLFEAGMGLGKVLRIFENCISKTFDSIGSYNYIRETLEKQIQFALENNKQIDGGAGVISNY